MKILNTLLISLLAYSASAQVGIGTSTPSVPLDIEAANAAIDINSIVADPLIHFQILSNTKFTIGVDSTDSKFKIGTTALETGTAVTVQPTGEVGIGTSAPTAKLHVDGDGTADGASILTITSDGDRDLEIRNPVDANIQSPWQFHTFNSFEFIVEEPGGEISTINIEGDGDVRVESDNNVNMLFVDWSADRIGVGTATPLEELHVDGQILTTTVTYAGSQDQAYLIAGSQSYTGATTNWGTYGFQHRLKSTGGGVGRITVDGSTGELFCINSGGNVGIGSSTPSDFLTIGAVAVSGQGGIMIEDPGNATYGAYFHYDDANSVVRLGGVTASTYNSAIVIPRASNWVGIGRTPVTNALEVNGTASKTASGDWLANSDARLKKDIKQMDSQTVLDKMLALKGVTYYWNDTVTGSKRPTQLQYGFTAQNIQEVFPILVEEDNLGYLQTAYGTYDAMYVESMRALQEQIDSQQMIIEAQKAEIATEKVENESQQEEIESLKTETTKKLAELEAKLNALLLLNSKGAVLTAEN